MRILEASKHTDPDPEHWGPHYTNKQPGKMQCCGSGLFIPDQTFFHPGSASKNLSILTQKNGF